MMRLGILGSTRGTNLAAIVSAIHQQQLAAEVAVVVSNQPSALILEKAKQYHLPFVCIESKGKLREAFDHEVTMVLQQHHVDLVILIGFMRILSADFIATWRGRILNVHPSLLPKHAGMMDLAVHRAVLAAGETITGCTVHGVTEVVDAGPVLVQATCGVFPGDTEWMIKQRVQALEGDALVKAIQGFV